MPGKAQDYVNQGKASCQAAVGALQQALGQAEKAQNKTIIQNAISALNTASNGLSNYKD